MLSIVSGLLLLLFVFGDQSFEIRARSYLVSEIRLTTLVTGLHTGLYKVDERVLRAMSLVPRENFLSQDWMAPYAYSNTAMPLGEPGHLQAEPFLTAIMIHLMNIDRNDKVLEIGYGTGYDAAVMSKLAGKVFSIYQSEQSNAKLAHHFKPVEERGYDNVTTRKADGSLGWEEEGPFDSILVKQSMKAPPAILLRQLKPYGRLVIPVGDPGTVQWLTVFIKLPGGRLLSRSVLPVHIQPLITGQEI